jgi:hypothetical protein
MLAISQEQQAMAGEMFNMFKYGVTYNPEEKVHNGNMIANPDYNPNAGSWQTQTTGSGPDAQEEQVWVPGNTGPQMIEDPNGWTTQGEMQGYDPNEYYSEMEFINDTLKAQGELLPFETEARKAQLETSQERSGLLSSIYKEALDGVDVDKRVSESRAGVQHAFKNSMGITNRNLSRMGIDPSSGRGLAAQGNVELERSKAMAGEEGKVRRDAEKENFSRKVGAAGLPIG